jgi:hypothetical protein
MYEQDPQTQVPTPEPLQILTDEELGLISGGGNDYSWCTPRGEYGC